MKIVRKRDRLTIVVIPDADQSVHRFTVRKKLLLSLPILVIILFLLCILFFLLYSGNELLRYKLQAELAAKQKQYSALIGQKEQTIQKLQADLAGLSEQTDEVMTKMERLEQLEIELRGMTGKAAALQQKQHDQAAKAAASLHNQSVGGVPYPLREHDSMHLSAHTKQKLTALTNELDHLYSGLTQMKKEVLAMQRLQAITPSIWPVSSRTITSRFGYRKDPFTGVASFHSGIDIGAVSGTPVYSAAEGTVVTAGYHSARGNNIVIDHGNGTKTWYMHLSSISVHAGDRVTKGQQIGHVGSTGRSTGPHLHYEVMIDGEKVDPKPYMKP